MEHIYIFSRLELGIDGPHICIYSNLGACTQSLALYIHRPLSQPYKAKYTLHNLLVLLEAILGIICAIQKPLVTSMHSSCYFWLVYHFDHTFRTLGGYASYKNLFLQIFFWGFLAHSVLYDLHKYIQSYSRLRLYGSVQYVAHFEMQWSVMCSMWVAAHHSCKNWM